MKTLFTLCYSLIQSIRVEKILIVGATQQLKRLEKQGYQLGKTINLNQAPIQKLRFIPTGYKDYAPRDEPLQMANEAQNFPTFNFG